MPRASIVLVSRSARQDAATWAMHAPDGTRVEFHPPGRTLDQNARMWAMCTEVARAVPWDGQRLEPVDWKLLFLDALPRPLRLVSNLARDGLVNLNRPTSSDLKPAEFAGLLDSIADFGAREGVTFGGPKEESNRERETAQHAGKHRRPRA